MIYRHMIYICLYYIYLYKYIYDIWYNKISIWQTAKLIKYILFNVIDAKFVWDHRFKYENSKKEILGEIWVTVLSTRIV